MTIISFLPYEVVVLYYLELVPLEDVPEGGCQFPRVSQAGEGGQKTLLQCRTVQESKQPLDDTGVFILCRLGCQCSHKPEAKKIGTSPKWVLIAARH